MHIYVIHYMISVSLSLYIYICIYVYIYIYIYIYTHRADPGQDPVPAQGHEAGREGNALGDAGYEASTG